MAVTQNEVGVTELPTERGVLRYPDRLLYTLWALFCLILIGVAVRDHRGLVLWKPLVIESSAMAFVTVLLVLQRTVGRRHYDRWLGEPWKWFGHHLKWLPLCILSFVVVVFGIRIGVFALLGARYIHDPWLSLLPYEGGKLTVYIGLWLGVIFAFDSFSRWHAQQRHLLELQRALAESRLAALSSQLRPHFFFNTLNTISALMHLDVGRADRLLASLGELLRASLQPDGQDLVPLAEELRLLELYAQIMMARFADRVTIERHIDETALNARVPAMLMQPLLENAFKHAVERGREKVRMEIAARREGSQLVLAIRNTGSTLPPNLREGVGLRNCRERLQVLYGTDAAVHLREDAAGVEASVTLPSWEPSS